MNGRRERGLPGCPSALPAPAAAKTAMLSTTVTIRRTTRLRFRPNDTTPFYLITADTAAACGRQRGRRRSTTPASPVATSTIVAGSGTVAGAATGAIVKVPAALDGGTPAESGTSTMTRSPLR